MDDFASETDSDYTSYWRDWVGHVMSLSIVYLRDPALCLKLSLRSVCPTHIFVNRCRLPLVSDFESLSSIRDGRLNRGPTREQSLQEHFTRESIQRLWLRLAAGE